MVLFGCVYVKSVCLTRNGKECVVCVYLCVCVFVCVCDLWVSLCRC